jgi:hypothetical protein
MTPQIVGWRTSAYGDQDPTAVNQGNSAYYVEVAKGMALKFPGSSPGGIYTVGYIDSDSSGPATAMPTQLQSTLGTMSSVHYASDNPDPEVMLTAFDNAGLSIILAIEPGNADINVLATKILGKYKNHPCVKGFGIDNEWYKTENGDVKITATAVTAFKNAILTVNPAYKVLIKHFNSSMLPAGISGVTYLTDACGFTAYGEALTEYKAWGNSFSGSEVAYQFGYDQMECGDNPSWWLNLASKPGYGTAAKIIADDISSSISNPIYSIFWADFTILTQFPIGYTSGSGGGGGTTCNGPPTCNLTVTK